MGHRFDFDFVPFTRDNIVDMSSDELHKHISKLKRMIREGNTLGRDTSFFEVEFCYLDHERQKRQRFDNSSPRKQSFRGEK